MNSGDIVNKKKKTVGGPLQNPLRAILWPVGIRLGAPALVRLLFLMNKCSSDKMRVY